MTVRRRLLSWASPLKRKKQRSLGAAIRRALSLINNPSLKLANEPESPKPQEGPNNLKIFTFSNVSSLHRLDLDPNFHKTVYGYASALDVLTKHGIACHVPRLISLMLVRCVNDPEFMFVIDFSFRFKPLVTPACYKALLDSLARTSLLSGIKRVYTEMLDVVSPGVDTFNVMVDVYSRLGYVVESNQFVCQMIQSGLAPNLSTFTSLIMGYKDLDAALRVFHKNMVEYGCAPDLRCYEHLVFRTCFAKKLGLAQRLLDQMQTQGITPSWIVFDDIVKCCCKLKRYGEAVPIVHHMISSGGSLPELKDCRTLICGLYEQGEKEIANAIFHKLLQCGEYNDDEIAWTILIGGLRKKKGLAKEFSQLFQAMQVSGCHLSPQTHKMFYKGLYRKTHRA